MRAPCGGTASVDILPACGEITMVRDKNYLLTPTRMVEGGEDYDWAKFEVRQRTQ